MPSSPAVLPDSGAGEAAVTDSPPDAVRLAISTAASAIRVSTVKTHCSRLE